MNKSYYCPKDCDFQLRAGGSFDNPEVGGCYIDDKTNFFQNKDFEDNPKLEFCPFYMRPLNIKQDSNEFTKKTLKARCFNCEHEFKISPKQFLFSYKIYCPSCRKYFDNPHAPKFKADK